MWRMFLVENRVFFVLYSFFLLVGCWLILTFEKGEDILYVNQFHTPYFTTLFKWVTQLAEFPALALILLLVAFLKFGNGLLLSLNTLVIFLLTAFLKNVIFANEVRPSIFFEGKVPLQFVDGLEIYRFHSFPSGHTAAGFAVFFMLSILSKNKKWSYLYFALALLIGVSRVYLLQHFFRDVYFGSLLAVLVTSIFWLSCTQSKWFQQLSWKNKSVLK